jgi:UrcA family protein
MIKVLFAIAALSATAPLAASERDTPQVARIHYADLDLTGAAGRVALDRRIKVALRDLCAEDQQLGLAKRLEEIRCLRAATAQVAAQPTPRQRRNADRRARNRTRRPGPANL